MATNYLSRSGTTPTSEQKGTFSAWVRVNDTAGSIGLIAQQSDGNNQFMIFINATSQFEFYTTTGGSQFSRLVTNAKLRDPSAWYLLQAHWDNAQSTSSDRAKLYINGVEQSLSVASYAGQSNYNGLDGTGNQIVGSLSNLSYDCKADIADLYYIDGATIAVTEFYDTDATTGEIKPNTEPTISSFGNAGYHLKFEDANLGVDSKPSGAVNFTTTGTIKKHQDNPSNVFATLNPLAPSSAALTLKNGNTCVSGANSNNYWQSVPSTLGATKGKFYWEFKDENSWGGTGDSTRRYGICDLDTIVQTLSSGADVRFSGSTSGYAYMNASGIRHNGSTISGTASTHPTFTDGDIIMCAMDLDNQKLYFGKNGTWNDSGDPTSGATGTGSVADISATATWSPYVETKYGSDVVSVNYGNGYFRTTAISSEGTNASGNGKFEYDVPAGYTALSTKGLNE